MDFRIRQGKTWFYIDLYTDSNQLIIKGSNQYLFKEDAQAAIELIKGEKMKRTESAEFKFNMLGE